MFARTPKRKGLFPAVRGFSLVELSIVMGIIAILAAISGVSAKYLRDRARMGIYYGYVHDVKEAALHFKQDLGFFPPDVASGIDPGLVSRNGYLSGWHSPLWETLDLAQWNGPYLHYRRWPENPWGGPFDWNICREVVDCEYGGISQTGIYLSARPSFAGGRDGLPAVQFEQRLQASGVDRSSVIGHISLYLGSAAEGGAPQGD